ncbi:aldo/keto reductase [Neorhodopirellula pilleata]|uniref:L-glyceraldehyde 3-phosphate reductase n=1 Tax=Neorhodopirellula pilleata TaxID=2714738 RepID=A0A5C6A6Y9_9BACT|nr:aldo/keto reductase [Neorhodopirellula pilleata]TWT95664.1 L-glyceraldehyde 3-phosphate reductase [Neorhodopirellula pilleata]
MQTRRLGRTDLDVSVLSIGGLYTSSLAGGESETRRIMGRAMELGINAIDTAPAYADSEATVGQAIRGMDAPLVMTTKLGGRPQPFDPQDIDALRNSVDESLRLLGRDCIEVLMIHEPDRPQQYPWWTGYDPLEGPALDLIDELKREGKIRYCGLAGTTVTEMTSLVESGRFDVVLTAFNYNVLYREAKDSVLAAATRHDMGIVLGSALGQGFLARRADEEIRRRPIWLSQSRQRQFGEYYRLLDESGISAVEMCLRFAISDPNVSTIPVGCKTVEHLEASVTAVEKGPLPIDVLSRLDEIAAMVPTRPFEEPMILPFGKSYFGPGIANMGAAVQVGKLSLSAVD